GEAAFHKSCSYLFSLFSGSNLFVRLFTKLLGTFVIVLLFLPFSFASSNLTAKKSFQFEKLSNTDITIPSFILLFSMSTEFKFMHKKDGRCYQPPVMCTISP